MNVQTHILISYSSIYILLFIDPEYSTRVNAGLSLKMTAFNFALINLILTGKTGPIM